jgi:nicotinamidase-related amidase
MTIPRLRISDAQLLIIDVQERLVPHIHAHPLLVQQITRMIRAAREMEMPVTFSVQYPRGLGETVPALAEFCRAGERFEKAAFSCCDDDNLVTRMRTLNKPHVIVTGIETHVCVQQTAFDLLESGFQPFVLADAVGSQRPSDYAVALERMRAAGVAITTVESAIYELMVRSGTELFKRILPIVK